jgi:hypothetical protein
MLCVQQLLQGYDAASYKHLQVLAGVPNHTPCQLIQQ